MKLVAVRNRTTPYAVTVTEAIASYFEGTSLADSALLWAACAADFTQQRRPEQAERYVKHAIARATEAGAVIEYR